MSVSHRYRNFGGAKKSKESQPESNAEALEDEKLQAFEAGYKAGWDDSTKAQADERNKLSSDLAQNLLDMSFTYHEAVSKLTLSFEPVMQQVIDKLLPETLRTALGAHLLEQVQALLKESMNSPVEIVLHPQNISAVRELLEDKIVDPFEIVGEKSLGQGQAFIRIGETESQLDLDTVVAEVSKAMNAFFHQIAKEAGHGNQ